MACATRMPQAGEKHFCMECNILDIILLINLDYLINKTPPA